ncbi:uncharacterized protein LOC144157911 [Haemaphysalis longicornis]
MSFSPARREEICRLARQISSHSLQLKDIVDAIYSRSGCRDSCAPPLPSNPAGVSAQRSATSGRSRKKPQDFSMLTKVSSSGGGVGGKGGEAKQTLRLQLPPSMATQFKVEQNADTGDLSAHQSLSGSLDSEGPKVPSTSHISRRPKPPKPPKAARVVEEPEPDHPRPYEDDPIWEVWESNMLKLIQLLKMLLNELRNVSEYTKINPQDLMARGGSRGMIGEGPLLTPEVLNSDVLATKLAASTIIGGLHNRENVSNALNNPPPFQQLYPPPQTVESLDPFSSTTASTGPKERTDLSVYFRKLATQMDALTQALRPNPFPPHAGAPMADRLIPLEENLGRLAHNLAGVSRAIARPVDPLDVLMSSRSGSVSGPSGMAGPRQLQVRTEAQMDDEGLISMANRANVSFRRDKPTSQQLSSAGGGYTIQSQNSSPLVASVNRLTEHMTEVQDMFRRAMGARPVPKAEKESMTISEEEDLRYCINRLTDNMCRVAQDLRRAMQDNTTVAASRLVDDAYYEDD